MANWGRYPYWYLFCPGAMENWGLVTYRETALLVDPKNTSARVKQWVALVVGHELAHQWFGNLVTMVRTRLLSCLKQACFVVFGMMQSKRSGLLVMVVLASWDKLVRVLR